VTILSGLSLLKQTILLLALSFYLALFPSYRNQLTRDSNPGQIFGVVAFFPEIFSPKHP
jgi:hypothetical protein